jgi:hypothetical protein
MKLIRRQMPPLVMCSAATNKMLPQSNLQTRKLSSHLPLLLRLMQRQKNVVYCLSVVDNDSVPGRQSEQKEKIR